MKGGAGRAVRTGIEKLREEIRRHDHLYYTVAQPEISDEAYDALMRELQELERLHPELITPDSPTQRVGGEPARVFPTVRHTTQMLSLANTYTEEDIRDFDRRVRELLHADRVGYVSELKFDGVSLALKYEAGVLRLGATRGDGVSGDDITGNVRTIRSVPLRLRSPGARSFPDCEVRGEVIMLRRDFEALNAERENSGERLFINPRNCVAGTLKMQDPKIVASRPLRFFAYSLLQDRRGAKSHYRNLQMLKDLGFLIDDHALQSDGIDGVIADWKRREAERDSLPFDVDGVVVKVDSLDEQGKLGSIAKSPRWAIACKFTSRKAETVLTGIRVQVGRMGTITPVADLEPVFLGGTTVRRASLYNEEYIRDLDIRPGDTVVVERGGDVIPKVTSVVKEKRPKAASAFVFPRTCPACGSALLHPEGEANSYCDNEECPMQVRARIEHWASRGAMDIAGLGEAVVDQLITAGLARNVADLYDLREHRGRLLELERWGEKSVAKLLEGIDVSRAKPYERVLYALGIRHVGSGVSAILAEHYPAVDRLKKAGREDLEAVPEIGPKIAQSIVHFFRDRRNLRVIERLRAAGLEMSARGRRATGGTLAGKTFVLTGTLSGMTRERARGLIEAQGGRVASGISSNVDALIVGEEAGSKLTKARQLGVEIWTEEKFLAAVGETEKSGV